MKFTAIIPARMAATRFPNKPLSLICGIPLIEHVRKRVSMCKSLDEIFVATCDREIRDEVEAAGGKVIMTADTHERCTDRIAEAATRIEGDVIVNVQGDEPLVTPQMIDDVIRPFKVEPQALSVNLVTEIVDYGEFQNPNVLKVVKDRFGDLLYISREPIPSAKKAATSDYLKLKQLGIIGFKRDFLQIFSRLEPTPLEAVESVDMLRAVEHGYKVKIVETKGIMFGVDVPSDVRKVEKMLESDPLFPKYR